MKSQKGFNLIELLVVIAIIGILTSIAMPAYSNYVIRGKIPDATSNLSGKRVQMEQWYQDNRTYATAAAAAGQPCFADTGTSPYFNFSCPVLTATTYQIQAVGKGTMAGFTYTIDQSNNKASTIVAPANTSWRATQGACWITNLGGSC